jgi:hypothetical protein
MPSTMSFDWLAYDENEREVPVIIEYDLDEDGVAYIESVKDVETYKEFALSSDVEDQVREAIEQAESNNHREPDAYQDNIDWEINGDNF